MRYAFDEEIKKSSIENMQNFHKLRTALFFHTEETLSEAIKFVKTEADKKQIALENTSN